MRIELKVLVDGIHWSGGASVEIPEIFRKTFEPLKLCDDPMIAYITGDIVNNSMPAKTIMKTRDDAAQILAKELTRLIVAEMQKNDTQNGYTIVGDSHDNG